MRARTNVGSHIQKCALNYLNLATRVVKDVNGGKWGKECDFLYPAICVGSLDGSCKKLNCENGYHVKFPFKKESEEVKEYGKSNTTTPKPQEQEIGPGSNEKKEKPEKSNEKNNKYLNFLGQILVTIQENQK